MRYHEIITEADDWDAFNARTKIQNQNWKAEQDLIFGPDATDEVIMKYVDNEMLGLELKQKKYRNAERNTPKFKKNKKIILNLLKYHSLKEVVKIQKAMRIWSTNQYARMNNSLRAGKTPASIQWIDMYMEHGPKFTGGLVYRGIDGQFLSTLEKGDTLIDPGYSATSKNPSIAKYFATRKTKGGVMEITGAAGLAVHQFANSTDEDEIIFPRNTKFKILDIVNDKLTVQASR